MLFKSIQSVLLAATMVATIFCSSASCVNVLFGALPSSFVAAGTEAHGCCASAVNANAADAPAEPVPSDPPRDCGDCLFMAGTYDSKWSGASLAVPQPSITDLPNWQAAVSGHAPTSGFGWTWQRATGLAPPGPLGSSQRASANFWQAGSWPAAHTTRPQLGVFLI